MSQTYYCSPSADDYGAYGIIIDSVRYTLDDQPDIAHSQGWGDLTWLRRY